MSRSLVTLLYKHKAGSMLRKSVLVAMADRANDDGTGVWISKQRIADEIEASRQGVVNAIKGLIADGLLVEVGERKCANGWTMEYTLGVEAIAALPIRTVKADPSKSVGVNKVSRPPNHVGVTPQPGVGDPPTQFTQTVHNRPEPSPIGESVRDAPAPPSKQKSKPKKRRAPLTVVPEGFALSEAARSFGLGKGMNEQEVDNEFERFRNWHAAKGTEYRDWTAAWRTWAGRWTPARSAAGASGAHRPDSSSDWIAAIDDAADRRRDGALAGRHGEELVSEGGYSTGRGEPERGAPLLAFAGSDDGSGDRRADQGHAEADLCPLPDDPPVRRFAGRGR
ncbi:MAG: hypothetical protein AAGK02_04610 [Pseudomonadota bacterium]